MQKDKLIGGAVLAFGVVAMFLWLRYSVFLPPLKQNLPTPTPNYQPAAQLTPAPSDMGDTIYNDDSTNPAQDIPDGNPFKASPTPDGYQNPFN